MDPVVGLVKNLLAPVANVERTMVMPFDKQRRENVAEHSFILGSLACSLAPMIDPALDLGTVAQLALAHDLVEVYAGDTTVWASDADLARKAAKESQALARIEAEYPDFQWISNTIRDYHALASPEARFLYALDKIVPHIMVVAAKYHPVRPTRDAYMRTERIAREKIGLYPALLPLFDKLCREFEANPEFFRD